LHSPAEIATIFIGHDGIRLGFPYWSLSVFRLTGSLLGDRIQLQVIVATPPLFNLYSDHKEETMRGKRFLAAACMLVVLLGSQGVLVTTARGQEPGISLADKSEYSIPLSPNAPGYTEYVYQQTTVGIGGTGAVIATCPDSAIVVGGGYSADPDVTFYTQYKYENGWRGDAINNSGTPEQITVYAVCLYNVYGPSVTQVHGQKDIYPGTKGQAVATCPAGSIATGGGFHAYPDGSLRVYNTSKADSGEGWQSWAYNNSSSTKTHHAYGICLSGSGGTTSEILESVDIASNSSGYAVPECSSTSVVTGGGFAAQENLLIYSNSGPYSIHQWRVYVKNTHPSDDKKLFGYAICLTLPGEFYLSVHLPMLMNKSSP
jgi:hypothetical protein